MKSPKRQRSIPSYLAFSLSLYLHPSICILFSSHFTSYNKQKHIFLFSTTKCRRPLSNLVCERLQSPLAFIFHNTYNFYLIPICGKKTTWSWIWRSLLYHGLPLGFEVCVCVRAFVCVLCEAVQSRISACDRKGTNERHWIPNRRHTLDVRSIYVPCT